MVFFPHRSSRKKGEGEEEVEGGKKRRGVRGVRVERGGGVVKGGEGGDPCHCLSTVGLIDCVLT